MKDKADAMGVLIRAGVRSENAAQLVGLNAEFIPGATPITVKLPTE